MLDRLPLQLRRVCVYVLYPSIASGGGIIILNNNNLLHFRIKLRMIDQTGMNSIYDLPFVFSYHVLFNDGLLFTASLIIESNDAIYDDVLIASLSTFCCMVLNNSKRLHFFFYIFSGRLAF